MRIAHEYFGDRFQVVVGTHIDKAHLHNHFVLNSVSFVDGHKYRNKLRYLDDLRALSDRFCREYELSVIDGAKKSGTEPYTDWKDRKSGTMPRSDVMRSDIDECIRQSLSFEQFISRMKGMGYLMRSEDTQDIISNSEFLLLLAQAPTDRDKFADMFRLSDNQVQYINDAGVGRGLIKCGNAILPFENAFPTDTALYRLMTTKLNEQ